MMKQNTTRAFACLMMISSLQAASLWQRGVSYLPRLQQQSMPYLQRYKSDVANYDAFRDRFYNQYWNTVKNKVAEGAYKNASAPLANIDTWLYGKPTKNINTKPVARLANTYAEIMTNTSLSPEETQAQLKQLAKEQGRTIAAEHQWEQHYKTMRDLINKLAPQSAEGLEDVGFGIKYAHQKQLGTNKNIYRDILNYVNQERLKQKYDFDIWGRKNQDMRKLYELLRD